MWNRLGIGVTLAVMPAMAAFAQQPLYGDDAACSETGLNDTGEPSYFDGQEIGGQDWSCTLDGQCSGEGEDSTDKFTVSIAETAVMISLSRRSHLQAARNVVGDRRPASPRRPNEVQKPLD